ncbi:sulfotransferase family protein [Sulfurimonas autotrophica]|uniref:Uncharacterized protein n=1 Tax=Sulfurimonas autotrophica (strain ATCC BAA-671 / DSM 16294 / JCM 11897 / OK10) TaxID=563040 RepID=E0UU22_SULAO|nr:hypothetical protein [Sulfurimonas autotrophica]ADN08331.1 conserved hypothetical protein [Sulfurimonas autotrophica DSM 16294]
MRQTAILVLGMHRSGTSALTGVLNMCDIYLGSELMAANHANEKGYFENNELFKVNEKLLFECNSSWDDIFYNEEKLENIKNIDELKKIIKKEFEYSNIFAIKDPRLAFLFPVYKKALEELHIDIKVILPYRNPVEVANSLHTRDGISMEKGMLLWGYYFLLAEKQSRGYERVFVDFDNLINETTDTVKMIAKSLNIDLDEKYLKNRQEIEKFLEAGLKHHNISIDNLSSKIPTMVQKVLALKDCFNNKSVLKKFDELRNEFFSYQKLFYNREIINFLEELQKTKETLTQSQETIAQKDKELAQTKETLTQSQETIAQKDKELAQTKETLTQSQETIAQKDKELTEVKENLAQKDKELTQAKESLTQKDKELTQAKESLTQKDKELIQVKEDLTQKDKMIKSKNKEIESLKDELVLIYTSRSWKFTKILRRIKRFTK